MTMLWQVVLPQGGQPYLCSAVLERVNWGWRYYRDPDTGNTWKENGRGLWLDSKEEALRDFIAGYYPDKNRLIINAACGGPTAEEELRTMVAACVLLWKEWNKHAQGGE